jgi:hypothetical protein
VLPNGVLLSTGTRVVLARVIVGDRPFMVDALPMVGDILVVYNFPVAFDIPAVKDFAVAS